MAFTGLLAVSSCTDDKPKTVQPEDSVRESGPRFKLTAKDSAEVLQLTGKFFGHLKAESYDSAVAMLYAFEGDTVLARLSGERASMQKALFKRFHGIRYELTSMQFLKETDNLVNYTITLFDNAPGERHSNTVRGALNPVRVGGQWYLTTVDSKTESKDGSELH